MKTLLRFGLLLLAVAAAAVIISRLRGRKGTGSAAGLPPEAHRPPAGPVAEPTPAEPDDLARVWGIGPVYRTRLGEAGITTFAQLAAADPAVVVATAKVPPARAEDWIAQAATLIGR